MAPSLPAGSRVAVELSIYSSVR